MAYGNAVIPVLFDKIPHDEKVVNIAHPFDNIKLVFQAFFFASVVLGVALFQALEADFIEVFPGGAAFGHVEFW